MIHFEDMEAAWEEFLERGEYPEDATDEEVDELFDAWVHGVRAGRDEWDAAMAD